MTLNTRIAAARRRLKRLQEDRPYFSQANRGIHTRTKGACDDHLQQGPQALEEEIAIFWLNS